MGRLYIYKIGVIHTGLPLQQIATIQQEHPVAEFQSALIHKNAHPGETSSTRTIINKIERKEVPVYISGVV